MIIIDEGLIKKAEEEAKSSKSLLYIVRDPEGVLSIITNYKLRLVISPALIKIVAVTYLGCSLQSDIKEVYQLPKSAN